MRGRLDRMFLGMLLEVFLYVLIRHIRNRSRICLFLFIRILLRCLLHEMDILLFVLVCLLGLYVFYLFQIIRICMNIFLLFFLAEHNLFLRLFLLSRCLLFLRCKLFLLFPLSFGLMEVFNYSSFFRLKKKPCFFSKTLPDSK